MPGREKEYEEVMKTGGAQLATGPAGMRPQIDDERRSRSPGLQNNFYDLSTADFKKPHGVRGSFAPEPSPPDSGMQGGGGMGGLPGMGGKGAPQIPGMDGQGMGDVDMSKLPPDIQKLLPKK